MSKFKIGQKVQIVENNAHSVNGIGAIGIITEIKSRGLYSNESGTKTCRYIYRVTVNGRMNSLNLSYEFDLRLAPIAINKSTIII